MDSLADFLAMGGYAAYVWPAVGLTLVMLIGFVVSPLSTVFYVASKQREDLVWQIAFLFGTGIACFAGLWGGAAPLSLMAFSAVGSILYLIYFALIRRYAAGAPKGDPK